MTTFEFPWPPSINHYWILSGHSKRLSRKARDFRAAVLARHGVDRAAFDGRCSVTIALSPPDRRRMDLDNRIKAVLDALTHVHAWRDDEQADRILIERGDVVKGGRCLVTLEEIKPCAR